MRVHGYTDEITVCDCCGKRNLKGTFGVETDDGQILHYGSVCVNKVYGKKRGTEMTARAKLISRLERLEWSKLVELYSRGALYGCHAFMGERMTFNNSPAQMGAITSFRVNENRVWRTIRERSA